VSTENSIYGTTYGPVQGMASLRTTARGKKVYVHLFDWPSATLEIKGLDRKVIAAHLLASGQSLTFRQDSAKLQIDVASRAPDPTSVRLP